MRDPEMLLRALILVIPAATLLLLVFLVFRKTGARRPAKLEAPQKAFDDPASPETEGPVNPHANKAEAIKVEVSEPDEDMTADVLEHKIKTAQARGETALLAGLYLDLGRARRQLGLDKEALDAMLSAAGTGAMYGPKTKHAEARLELAEVAYRAGDLTTACEHWQIARTALQDDGQAKGAAAIDKRMRDNGCPTDWVLTDF